MAAHVGVFVSLDGDTIAETIKMAAKLNLPQVSMPPLLPPSSSPTFLLLSSFFFSLQGMEKLCSTQPILSRSCGSSSNIFKDYYGIH